MSFGYLTKPTVDWVMKAKTFEHIFKKFHKGKFDIDLNIVRRLSNFVQK